MLSHPAEKQKRRAAKAIKKRKSFFKREISSSYVSLWNRQGSRVHCKCEMGISRCSLLVCMCEKLGDGVLHTVRFPWEPWGKDHGCGQFVFNVTDQIPIWRSNRESPQSYTQTNRPPCVSFCNLIPSSSLVFITDI